MQHGDVSASFGRLFRLDLTREDGKGTWEPMYVPSSRAGDIKFSADIPLSVDILELSVDRSRNAAIKIVRTKHDVYDLRVEDHEP